jgi:predicted SAM-dependent methyltransferase
MKSKAINNAIKVDSQYRYLNLGCGKQFHEDWVNLDLESSDPTVIKHDLAHGVPFQTGTFDAVYHSHVLEHLKPEQGERLIEECFRVLKPGGILRVVVPDLERIALLYLEMHERAWDGDDDCKVNYNWMKLELLDQLVRECSGGRMGKYMASREIENSEFVRERVGDEFSVCQSLTTSPQSKPSVRERLKQKTLSVRKKTARRVVRWLLGRRAEEALDEGVFRVQGEIHRWMYDRYSLRELSQKKGFDGFQVCQATESSIVNYDSFELDAIKGRVRKPDSIFVECQKPRVGASSKRVAGSSDQVVNPLPS